MLGGKAVQNIDGGTERRSTALRHVNSLEEKEVKKEQKLYKGRSTEFRIALSAVLEFCGVDS